MKGDEERIFDEFLRKSVGNYRAAPPPGIWGSILKQISAGKGAGASFLGGSAGWMSMIAGGVIVSSVAVYQFVREPIPAETSVAPTEVVDTVSTRVASQENPAITPILTSFLSSQPKAEENPTLLASVSPTITSTSRHTYPILKPVSHSNVIPEIQEPTAPVSNSDNEMDPELIASPALKNSETLADPLPSHTEPLAEPAVMLASTETAKDIIHPLIPFTWGSIPGMTHQDRKPLLIDPSKDHPKTFRLLSNENNNYRRGSEIQTSLFYQPEWLTRPEESPFSSTRNTAGVTVGWRKSSFIIETGLAVMQEKGRQDYDITYKTLLGTYQNLLYIIFDTIGGVPVPTYYYSIDSVFDPMLHQQKKQLFDHYTYLQIPFMLGYVKGFGRTNFSFKAGPVLSLLLQSRESRILLADDQYITSLGGDYTTRSGTAWQWQAAVRAGYDLTEHLSFFVEPTIRGYLGSPYQQGRTPKERPLYLGIKSGITLTLFNTNRP